MNEIEKSKTTCCNKSDECSTTTLYYKPKPWIVGSVNTKIGPIPRVSTKLTIYDKMSSWKVRWGIKRMNYKVDAGLYCVGNPNSTSPVLVTANYKMSFDLVRRELAGRDIWILVLDTKGVNVWCAAGKGTFGTAELINRIYTTNLSKLVSHRQIVVPQLGAPGISAHEVRKKSEFNVVYGPVRASDLCEFLDSQMKCTREMRKVNFNILDRLVLTPIELVSIVKPSIVIIGLLYLLNSLTLAYFSKPIFKVFDLIGYLGAIVVGCVLVPLFLPWIPGKAFAFKGWILGFIWVILLNLINGVSDHYLRFLGQILIIPSVSSFLAVNFTGSSTYTSFSGVLKEMKIVIPAIIFSIVTGFILIVFQSLKLG